MRGRPPVSMKIFSLSCVAPVDGDLVRPGEPRVAAVEMQVWALGDLRFLSAAEAEHDLVFLRDDLRQIDAGVARDHAPALRVAGVVGHLGALHHGFGRRASGIDAGAAEVALLDEGDRPA